MMTTPYFLDPPDLLAQTTKCLQQELRSLNEQMDHIEQQLAFAQASHIYQWLDKEIPKDIQAALKFSSYLSDPWDYQGDTPALFVIKIYRVSATGEEVELAQIRRKSSTSSCWSHWNDLYERYVEDWTDASNLNKEDGIFSFKFTNSATGRQELLKNIMGDEFLFWQNLHLSDSLDNKRLPILKAKI